MKYKIGDIINEKLGNGNGNDLGYITYVNEKAECLDIVFFAEDDIEYNFTFSVFEGYYKVL